MSIATTQPTTLKAFLHQPLIDESPAWELITGELSNGVSWQNRWEKENIARRKRGWWPSLTRLKAFCPGHG